jgi:hypothetical protein
MSDQPPSANRMQTIAACAYCGRGYVTLAREGVGCIARCGGRLWKLPAPENDTNDDPATRARRKKLLRDWATHGEVTHAD